MEAPQSSLEEFLSDLPKQHEEEKTIDELLVPPAEQQAEEPIAEAPRENRETRRLRKRLEQSEQMNKELVERVASLAEKQDAQQAQSTLDEYLSKVERIYGTQTPEAREATEILKDTLRGIYEASRKDSEQRYESLMQSQQASAQEQAEIAEAESELDGFLDDIEDEYGVDMTSNTREAEARRQAFFQGLERYSRKQDGVVIDYADPIAVWEQVQTRSSTQTSKAKDIASRAMTRSGSGAPSVDDSETVRYLREQGIL